MPDINIKPSTIYADDIWARSTL